MQPVKKTKERKMTEPRKETPVEPRTYPVDVAPKEVPAPKPSNEVAELRKTVAQLTERVDKLYGLLQIAHRDGRAYLADKGLIQTLDTALTGLGTLFEETPSDH